jgi:hypothetical protein
MQSDVQSCPTQGSPKASDTKDLQVAPVKVEDVMRIRKLAQQISALDYVKNPGKGDLLGLLCHVLAIIADFEFYDDMARRGQTYSPNQLGLAADRHFRGDEGRLSGSIWKELRIQPRCVQNWIDDIETVRGCVSSEERMINIVREWSTHPRSWSEERNKIVRKLEVTRWGNTNKPRRTDGCVLFLQIEGNQHSLLDRTAALNSSPRIHLT